MVPQLSAATAVDRELNSSLFSLLKENTANVLYNEEFAQICGPRKTPDFPKPHPQINKKTFATHRKVGFDSVRAMFALALSQDDLKSAVSQPRPFLQPPKFSSL